MPIIGKYDGFFLVSVVAKALVFQKFIFKFKVSLLISIAIIVLRDLGERQWRNGLESNYEAKRNACSDKGKQNELIWGKVFIFGQ